MAFKQADRVKETTTTTGTGTLSLAGAVAQFQTFVAGIATTNTCDYCLVDANGTGWEVGTGTVTSGSPDTLSRTTVYASTNSGSAISLSAGTHTVFVTGAANHLTHSLDLDNALGSTQGDIAYRSATGWTVLAPGTSGQLLQTGGASANPSWATPAGGGNTYLSSGLYSPLIPKIPTQANTGFTTWVNQGSATATDTAVGISIRVPGGGSDNLRILKHASLTAPFSQRFLVGSSIAGNNYQTIGVGFTDGTKYQFIGIAYDGGGAGAWVLSVGQWPTASTSGSNTLWPISGNPVWFRLRNTGTHVFFEWSISGDSNDFITLLDVNLSGSPYLSAYTDMVFFVNRNSASGSQDAVGTLMSAPDILTTPTVPVNLENLANVTIASPVSGQSLHYTGTVWTNSPPSQSNTGFTTWGNQGSATVTDTSAGMIITAPSNGNAENFRILYKAAPTAPYKITAQIGILSSFIFTEHVLASIGWYDGTKTSQIGGHIGGVNGQGFLVNVQCSNNTTLSVQSSANDIIQLGNPFWVQLYNDGTSVHFLISIDGKTFRSLRDTVISGSFLANYNNIFFGVDAYGAAITATLMQYRQE